MYFQSMLGLGFCFLPGCLFTGTVSCFDDVQPEPSPVMEIASKVLDENISDVERVRLIRSKPEFAADLLQTFVEGIDSGTIEESSRIPWLWEISVLAIEKYNGDNVARILEISIPKQQSLAANWQVAVIGGGLIFQLSKKGKDPRGTIEEIVSRDPLLKNRWQNLIKMSKEIMMDESQSLGIRYDALRIFAMSDWSKAKKTYLKLFEEKQVDSKVRKELRLAAVSAASDFKVPETTEFFVDRFSLLSIAEREKFCWEFSKNEGSAIRLLKSIKNGVISTHLLNRKTIQFFKASASEKVRNFAVKVFQSPF